MTQRLHSRLPLWTVLRTRIGDWAWIVVGKDDSGRQSGYTLRSIHTGYEHLEKSTTVHMALADGIISMDDVRAAVAVPRRLSPDFRPLTILAGPWQDRGTGPARERRHDA